MARPLRIDFAGALYHITARGNALGDIFQDDADRRRFMDLLAEVCELFHWHCHAGLAGRTLLTGGHRPPFPRRPHDR